MLWDDTVRGTIQTSSRREAREAGLRVRIQEHKPTINGGKHTEEWSQVRIWSRKWLEQAVRTKTLREKIRNWILSFWWPGGSTTRLSQFVQDFPGLKTKGPASRNLLSPKEHERGLPDLLMLCRELWKSGWKAKPENSSRPSQGLVLRP